LLPPQEIERMNRYDVLVMKDGNESTAHA